MTLISETILLVDDDAYIRAFTRILLERAGYTVLTAPDGEQGLRVFETHASSIGLLLTDFRMPGLNGAELADRVLAADSKPAVLIMTGDGQKAAGEHEFIEKPVTPSTLLQRVAEVLNASARRNLRKAGVAIAK